MPQCNLSLEKTEAECVCSRTFIDLVTITLTGIIVTKSRWREVQRGRVRKDVPMNRVKLFTPKNIIGRFTGFKSHGLEFHADLILTYQRYFQRIPMHGQFILIQLETPYEAILGRIVSLGSYGTHPLDKSEYAPLRAKLEEEGILDEFLEGNLKYRVNMHVLGVLYSREGQEITFVASHRRFPHPESNVAFPSDGVLQEIAGHYSDGVAIGHLALGEYVYSEGEKGKGKNDQVQSLSPKIVTRFSVTNLIARRSFIFARAGFGKSNLNKLLFSELYKQTPVITSRWNEAIPVGTVIFDPDGEYFWPDNKGRPGLCDVPELQDNIVVFTGREAPSDFYQSFVAGGVKLDIRKLKPKDVLSIALCSRKQEQQNTQKLKDLAQQDWADLVDLIEEGGNSSSLDDISTYLHLEKKQGLEALAARANMTTIVQLLHDRNSQLMDMLSFALSHGKLCVIDISQMHDTDSLILTGLILHTLFKKNQDEFTKRQSTSIPIIAVIEEAQSVLTRNTPAVIPHLNWVKEGRKYDLGCVLVTQQPGSIPVEILSQGDNWFVLHLLSSTDLFNLQKANAYFSQDIIAMLQNEPLPGHGSFWSSVAGKSYPIPMRVLSFEQQYAIFDENYDKPVADTFAQVLQEKFCSTSILSGEILHAHITRCREHPKTIPV